MGLPRAETHPAELRLAVLVPAHHVVTATILLYGHMTLRTFLQNRAHW